jgi:hypothetical protein
MWIEDFRLIQENPAKSVGWGEPLFMKESE